MNDTAPILQNKLPTEVLCALFSWIGPDQVLRYRRLCKRIDECLRHPDFARQCLNRAITQSMRTEHHSVSAFDRLWFSWPVSFQNAFLAFGLGVIEELEWSPDPPLTGQIPKAIGKLPLRIVILADNHIGGCIPSEMGQLTNLAVLNLAHNSIEGPLPVEIGNLVCLRELILSHNRLVGPIPEQIGGLISLETLSLDNNKLSGLVPKSIGRLTKLLMLDLAANDLVGPLPQELSNLRILEDLLLGKTRLTMKDVKGKLAKNKRMKVLISHALVRYDDYGMETEDDSDEVAEEDRWRPADSSSDDEE